MHTEEISDISSLLGPILAAGTERVCVQNLANPFSCFKLGKFGPCKQTVREVEYFNFLKKREYLLLSFQSISIHTNITVSWLWSKNL